MNVEVLVSTMNLKNIEEYKKLKKKMNITTASIVINQITEKDIGEFEFNDKDSILYSKKEKGLSRSRNKAIELMKADIGVIADDDIVYTEDYEQKIIEAYEKHPKADIIAFYVESYNTKRATTKQNTGKIGFIKTMKVASFQITFKKDFIIKNNLKFDEDFGAGALKYVSGEENIFLFDCLKKKCNIYFVNEKIANVYHVTTTWFDGFNEKYFTTKGACFYRMSPKFANLLIYQLAIRKIKLFREDCDTISAIKLMLKGKKQYKNYLREKTNE